MSFSSTCKNINVLPSSREQISDSAGMIVSQGGCFTHEHGEVLGSELGLMEMTEVDCSHLQHLLQAHVEAQSEFPDVRCHLSTVMVKEQATSTVISPFRSAQAIDLSTSNEDHCIVMPGEKTPVSYGEVPGFVLARIRAEESPAEPFTSDKKSVQNRTRPAARVCLEKRFSAMCAETTRQQDIQSAVLSNFLTILQQSAEVQETVTHPPKQKWVKMDRANSFGVSSSYIEGVYGPVTNTCGQVMIPKSVLNFHPAEEQPLVNLEKDAVIPAAVIPKAAKAAPDSAGEPQSSRRKIARSSMLLSQRRERHNSKERERRKRIRLCCDELNALVPFCDSETDKVTTLQWTTAFLRYITKTYGDTFKEEFQKVFAHERERFGKSSSGQDPVHHRMDETLSSISLAAEQ
ncbi:uncharacterized protein LOC102292053 isoform X1 [Haplochromis burtoni]|uniref:uncharacterized protein LOC102292053 isoform X1 n=1 Tax=Haplochromis burtoni TaxID=8153 RepID=UPI0006C96804|nr:uncharacterized protein LOC102292053 isoform X1 [Haplochromis burtoni]